MAYHERQERQRCLRHALNNLLGGANERAPPAPLLTAAAAPHSRSSLPLLAAAPRRCSSLPLLAAAPRCRSPLPRSRPHHRSLLPKRAAPAFTTADLDRLAAAVPAGGRWPLAAALDAHLGNWDANVLLTAAQSVGLEATMVDARAPNLRAGGLDVDGGDASLVGVILNVASDSLWGRLTGGRHWLALRRAGAGGGGGGAGGFVNCDSQLPGPEPLADARDFIESRRAAGAHVFALRRLDDAAPPLPAQPP